MFGIHHDKPEVLRQLWFWLLNLENFQRSWFSRNERSALWKGFHNINTFGSQSHHLMQTVSVPVKWARMYHSSGENASKEGRASRCQGVFHLAWHSLGSSFLDQSAAIGCSKVCYSAQPVTVLALKAIYSSIFPREIGTKVKLLWCRRISSFNSSWGHSFNSGKAVILAGPVFQSKFRHRELGGRGSSQL